MNDGVKVMILDDDKEFSDILRYALVSDALQVEAFTDPRMALSEICRETPDLILLDYEMPLMNGAQFLEELQKLNLPNAPFIILTTAHEKPDIAENLLPQIKKVLNKPFTVKKLLLEVKRQISIMQN